MTSRRSLVALADDFVGDELEAHHLHSTMVRGYYLRYRGHPNRGSIDRREKIAFGFRLVHRPAHEAVQPILPDEVLKSKVYRRLEEDRLVLLVVGVGAGREPWA